MADNDDTTVVEQDETKVDEQDAQDEKDESQGEATSGETADKGTSSDSDEASDDKFERRFTRFKGDSPEEYIKNLEQGYDNSSKEALRWKKKFEDTQAEKLSAAATDTKADSGEDAPQSLTDAWVSQEMKRRNQGHFEAFVAKHPEVNEDEDLFSSLDEHVTRYMNFVVSTERRAPELDEALAFAWGRVKPGDSGSKDEQVAAAVKSAGAGSKSKGTTKDQPKPLFTDAEIEVAKKFDPKLRDKSRVEIEKELAKYKN